MTVRRLSTWFDGAGFGNVVRSEIEPKRKQSGKSLENMFHAKFYSFSVVLDGKKDVALTNFIAEWTARIMLACANAYVAVRPSPH